MAARWASSAFSGLLLDGIGSCQSPAYSVYRGRQLPWTKLHQWLAAPRCSRLATSAASASLSETQEVLSGAQTFSLPALRDFVPRSAEDTASPPVPSLQDGGLPLSGEPDSPRLRVALLLSGGVDSSMALKLLQAAGHEVTAFYLQIWFQEDFRNFWDACPWEDDLAVCQQVCQDAGVQLNVVPLTEQYWDRVVSHCLAEIRAGRTPNPDVLCNSRVKFGAFYEYLESQHGPRFDRIASGHYARVLRDPADPSGGPVSLALTPDPVKDQTYFLAHLTQQQLARTMFPLGTLTKAEVRRLAAALELPNKARKDSQGICFLGKVRFSEFVRAHLDTWPGPIVEEETNEIVGYHEGFWFYTLGQRKGIYLSGGPWYVSSKNPDMNVVYVSRNYFGDHLQRNSFECGDFNWIGDARPLPERPLLCKVRHGQTMYRCELEWMSEGVAKVVLEQNDQGLAAGQFACFYQDDICLGSAVIKESHATMSRASFLTDAAVD